MVQQSLKLWVFLRNPRGLAGERVSPVTFDKSSRASVRRPPRRKTFARNNLYSTVRRNTPHIIWKHPTTRAGVLYKISYWQTRRCNNQRVPRPLIRNAVLVLELHPAHHRRLSVIIMCVDSVTFSTFLWHFILFFKISKSKKGMPLLNSTQSITGDSASVEFHTQITGDRILGRLTEERTFTPKNVH